MRRDSLTMLVVMSSLLVAAPAYAEQFLGVEGGDQTEVSESEGDDGDVAEDPAASAPQAKAPPVSSTKKASRDSEAPPGGRYQFSGGLGAGLGYFRADLSMRYSVSRWVAWDTSGFYIRHETGDATGTMYGPEIDLVLLAPNPTPVTPFVGAGPGYHRWQREYKKEVYNDGGSATGNAFAGFHISLTKHFGIIGIRKQVTYLGDPPLRLAARETAEPRTAVTTSVGFHIVL